MRVEAPRTPIERSRWIFQGCGDVLDRLRGRGEPNPISEAADRLATSMLAFAAFALGGLDVAQDPELPFGPDPIVRTPRTIRGKRPLPRPEWRSVNEPPESSDVPRLRGLFDMFHAMEIALFGTDENSWDRFDVETLYARLNALGDEELLRLAPFTEDAASFLVETLACKNPLQLRRRVRGLLALSRAARVVQEALFAFGDPDNTERPKVTFDKLLKAIAEQQRRFGQTAGHGTEPPPGRGSGPPQTPSD